MLNIKGQTFGEGAPIVCVPIVEKTKESILAEAVALATDGAQMLEWRIDFFEKIKDAEAVIETARKLYEAVAGAILLITFRSKKEGGQIELEETYLRKLLEKISQAKVCDLIDVEIKQTKDARAFIAKLHEGGAKVISSYHNFSITPDDAELNVTLDEMKNAGADIVKLAVMPQNRVDVARLLLLTAQFREANPDTAIATMSMGGIGVSSRICGEMSGSCLTFGAGKAASAPGQVAKDELADILSVIHRASDTKPNVFLIGFMGCGKSRISAELSRLSGMPVIDTDAEIVERFGMSIPEIFEKYGEERFRLVESQVIAQVAGMDGQIISCGGGVILREINRKNIKRSGICVQLTATPATILSRVSGDTNRPLLKGHMNEPDIAKMLADREPNYALARDVSVATDNRKPEDIAKEIMDVARI